MDEFPSPLMFYLTKKSSPFQLHYNKLYIINILVKTMVKGVKTMT